MDLENIAVEFYGTKRVEQKGGNPEFIGFVRNMKFMKG